MSAFEEGLAGGPGEQYLADRGIPLATARDFRIGFVSTDDVPGFEYFVGRLAIPNICASGHVVSVKFRYIDDEDHERKYDGPAGQQMRLFNTRALLADSDYIAVTEGEMDCITLGALGIPAVSVPSGAGSWNSKIHPRLLDGYERVVVFRDNDEAGSQLVRDIKASDLPVHVVSPPAGTKDVNEAHVKGFDDQIIQLVKGATK